MQKTTQPTIEEMNELFLESSRHHQNGLLDAAESGYQRLLDYFPEAPMLHFNLGLVYYEQGEYENGRDSFARAADLSPDDMDILFNLGLTQKKTGDPEGAIVSYRRILETDPESIDTLYNLAGCYKDSGENAKAIKTYLELLRYAPDHLSAISNLAFVYHIAGGTEQAVYYYKKVLEFTPDHQAAKHMLAALTGSESVEPPESYVRDIFDNYSSHYERSLVVELEYRVPATIRELLDERTDWKKSYNHGLDLGCGTGLGAQAFYDMINVFDGVDLSEKMIAMAAAKNLYRKLVADNIIHFLRSSPDSYDFYLASDVFAYVGDLEATFSLLRDRACRDVLFCFSTEHLDGSGYRLQQTGRFAHTPAYIEKVARATGWRVAACRKASLRKEKGSWVEGDLWFLQLTDNSR
ncbi:MAG: tetratricopeptide repeat protein [Desulforhopalus sp.]